MREIPWQELGNDNYIAVMRCGRAVITPRTRGVYGKIFDVRLELPSGEVIAESEFDFDLVDTAMDWASVRLPCLDLVEGEFSECGLVGESLNLCQQLISRETDAFHWLRIEYIKKWMTRHSGQAYEIVEIPVPEYPSVDFIWSENDTHFFVDTPHGRAVILEVRNKNIVGGGLRHQARIVHPTGATLNCGSWIDFSEAENAIREGLERLQRPEIWESQLPCIHFTFDLCERVLPDDADPIHAARLSMLGMHIHLALE